jgi:hypothetical protein
MSKTSVVGLLLATFSVSASLALYSASTERNNVVSDEVVAAYFNKNFEAEDINPVMAMEYLVRQMGSKKKGGDETSEYHSKFSFIPEPPTQKYVFQ